MAVKQTCVEKKETIDIGLAVLESVREPHQIISVTDIADVCDCSTTYINRLIRNALKKLQYNRALKEFNEMS